MDEDFISGGVEDQRHDRLKGACFMEHLISSTSWCYPNGYQTASACPSNLGQSFVIPM